MSELDASMPFLVAALDITIAERELNSACTKLAPMQIRSATIVRHKPGRRCLIEYVADSNRGRLHILGKARGKGVDHRTWELVQRLRESGFNDGARDGINVPEPLGVVPAFNMWLQTKVTGRPVKTSLEDMHRVADAIGKLHKTKICTSREHHLADELAILDSLLLRLGDERPNWSYRLGKICENCRRLAAHIKPGVTCGIHRDFYADQVLIDNSHIFLLDLDLYCLGDPLLDIGNFMGHLIEQAVRHGNVDLSAESAEAFVERYSQLTGIRCRPNVEKYATLTLARLIAISQRIVERRPWTEALMDLCERRLNARSSSPMVGMTV